jgi:hypothetical protein
MNFSKTMLAATVFVLAASPFAFAEPSGRVTVLSTDVIYSAGQTTVLGGGTIPQGIIPVTSDEHEVVIVRVRGNIRKHCASSERCVTLNGGQNLNDADGTGGQLSSSSNTGYKHISGIKAPGEGYLVGVFLRAGGPSGKQPVALDFTTGEGTAFVKLKPRIDQTFFVGDGRTLDGLSPHQHFIIPHGATSLVLGISDTCENGNGPPGCYYDNRGSFTVEYKTK